MALPDVKNTIKDGALGLLPEATDNVFALIGPATGGTVNTVYSVGDTDAAKAAIAGGKLYEASAHHFAVAGAPQLLVPVNASVAGANGAITKSNAGGPTVTVAGAPVDDYQFVIAIVTTGALGAGTFKYTLDGGDNYSAEIVIPSGGTYALGDSGVTATFPIGTYTSGDTYTWTGTAPGYTLTDLNAAIDALLADPREWAGIHVIGAATTAAGTASIAAGVATKLAAAELAHRPGFAVLECADETDSAILTAFTAFADSRVAVAAGYCELVSQVTGRIQKRNAAWPAVARAAAVSISEDLARVATGALKGVTRLYRDEQKTPALDAARFITLRTHVGEPGFYVTNPRLMSSSSSDFKYLQHRRIMDKACRINRKGMLRFLNETFLVEPTTSPRAGKIREADASNIEAYVGGQLRAALVSPGHVSDAQTVVNRDDVVLSTNTVRTKVRVTPPFYGKTIETEMAFSNPALGT